MNTKNCYPLVQPFESFGGNGGSFLCIYKIRLDFYIIKETKETNEIVTDVF